MTEDNFTASHTDTGLWRLTVYLSDHSLRAWLHIPAEPEREPRQLLDLSWPRSEDGLLQRISNSIYDHPQILDDYSASVVIEAPDTLLVPASLLGEESDAERIYAKVFSAREEDVMTDEIGGREAALFTLTPGLKGFLQRTFPGARIECHLNRLKRIARSHGDGIRLFADLRDGMADLLAFDGQELLSASTQICKEWSDVAFHIINLMDIYELRPENTSLLLAGNSEVATSIRNFFAEDLKEIGSFDGAGSLSWITHR